MKRLTLLLALLLPTLVFAQGGTPAGGYGPSSSSSSSSGLPTGDISPTSPSALCPGCTAKADLQLDTTATVTNGSSAVTTSAGAPAFTTADTGKDCFATSGGGTGVTRISGKLSLAEGTFTQSGAHTGNCSTTANAFASGAATNFFFWATNDTTAMTAAYTAANPTSGPCKTIFMPGSPMLVTTNFGSTAAGTCGFNLGGASEGIGVVGNGFGSILVIGPAFDFTTCTGGNNSCLFAHTGLYLAQLVIYGAERADCPAAANGKILVGINNDSEFNFVQMVGWCSSDANASTVGFGPSSSSGSGVNYINVDGFGSTCFSTGNYPIRVSGSTFIDCKVAAMTVTGGVLTSTDNFFGDAANAAVGADIVVSAGIWQSTGDNCVNFASGAQNGIRVSGGTANITDMQCYMSVNTSSSALWVSGGTVNVSLSTFKGGTGGTGVDLFLDTGKFNNLGGNSFLNNTFLITNNGTVSYSGMGAFTGSCSGVGTAASTLGEYGLGQFAALTCTSTVVNLGQVAENSGTVYGVLARATAAGTNASSGVVTVLKNGSTQAITCTIGTSTFCKDSTTAHGFTFVQGDVLSCQFTTQAADTLAGVKCIIVANYL